MLENTVMRRLDHKSDIGRMVQVIDTYPVKQLLVYT